MPNDGSDEERVFASDVPNIDSICSSNSYKSAIRGEVGTSNETVVGYKTFGHNCSRIRVPDCGNIPFTGNEVGTM